MTPLRRLERRACEACAAFAAECEVPRGDGAIAACWMCAHVVIVHNAEPGDLGALERCRCPGEAIYPEDVWRRIKGIEQAYREAPVLAVVPDPADVHPIAPEYRPTRGVLIALGQRRARRARAIAAMVRPFAIPSEDES